MRRGELRQNRSIQWAVWPTGLLLVLSFVVRAERLPLKTYTTADGLAHNVINKIVRDSRGFLWFCTEEGLSRFDGYSFTNFGMEQGLPHASVNDLLETRGGDYWMATGGESVAAMSDIVWAINPQRDHLIDLVRRMRREAEELFTARDIKLGFQAPGEEQNLRLGVDVLLRVPYARAGRLFGEKSVDHPV
jgi:ligand-binding sensor domain-containing protein